MVSLYIEQVKNSGEYFIVDLYPDETLVLNYKVKDSSDISTAFSTYSQTFTIQASPNNLNLLQFVFDPAVNYVRDEYINAKLYINNSLFKVGQILVSKGNFSYDKLTSFDITFFTSLTTFKDIVGSDLLSVISEPNVYSDENGVTITVPPSTITMKWTDEEVFDRLSQYQDDGIIVPLISVDRVINYGVSGSSVNVDWVDATKKYPNALHKDEFRPALKITRVVNRIQEYYGVKFESKLFDKGEFKDLFIHATGENFLEQTLSQYELDIQHPFGLTAGSPKTFRVDADLDTNIFKVSRVDNTNSYVNFNVQIMPRENVVGRLQNDPDPIIGEFTFINRTPGFEGQILEKNKRVFAPGSGITYPYYTFSTLHITNTMVSTTAPLYFSVEVKWNAVITWDRAMFSIVETPNGALTRYLSDFNHNYDQGFKVDVLKSLPDMKVIDFMSSLFKMFNLRVQENGYRSLKFYLPEDFNTMTETNIGGEVDYTNYVDRTSTVANKVEKFKNYKLTHKTSKYYSNVKYAEIMVATLNSKEYGQLLTLNPNYNLNDTYTVETKFAECMPVLIDNMKVNTFYGFTDADPTVSTTTPSFNLYKPNTSDFTIYYYGGETPLAKTDLTQASMGFYNSSIQTTYKMDNYNRFSVDNSKQNGLGQFTPYTISLGFKDEPNVLSGIPYQYNLYSKYYNDYFARVLDPRVYTFDINLVIPTIELMNFDMKNVVIIGNRKYTIESAQLDLTTGKCKLTLMNAVAVSKTYTMWSIDSYSSPNLYFTRNYGTDTAVTVQTSTNGTTWVSNTSGALSPRNIRELATGTLIRLKSTSDSTISNVITV